MNKEIINGEVKDYLEKIKLESGNYLVCRDDEILMGSKMYAYLVDDKTLLRIYSGPTHHDSGEYNSFHKNELPILIQELKRLRSLMGFKNTDDTDEDDSNSISLKEGSYMAFYANAMKIGDVINAELSDDKEIFKIYPYLGVDFYFADEAGEYIKFAPEEGESVEFNKEQFGKFIEELERLHKLMK